MTDKGEKKLLQWVAWLVLGLSGYFAITGDESASMLMFFAFIAIGASSFFK